MKKEKTIVYDLPIVTKQKFKVSIPGKMRCIVTRKQVDRQSHNTACDVADSYIDYEIWQEVDQEQGYKQSKQLEKK